jgi:hypothetical protein
MMTAVLQFKIELKGTQPLVWRRIQVLNTATFWDLHVAINDAMGWMDRQVHQFEVLHPQTGMIELFGVPDQALRLEGVLAGWMHRVSSYLSLPCNHEMAYVYDFKDAWEHRVIFESEQPAQSIRYPICLGGGSACPPEDVGGPAGYQQFLHAIHDPHHAQHRACVSWVGRRFDPEFFDLARVEFDDADRRLLALTLKRA